MVDMSNSSLKVPKFQLFTRDSLAQMFYCRFVVHLQVCYGCVAHPLSHVLVLARTLIDYTGTGLWDYHFFKGKLEIHHTLLSFFFQFSLSELFKVILGSHHHRDLTAYSTSALYY